MIRNSIIHSYSGRYLWDKGLDANPYQVPANYLMSKTNGFVPSLNVDYQTWYTKDGVYVGNTRGGATRVEIDSKNPNGPGIPINPNDYNLELRTVKVRIIPYPINDPKRYDALQPMRDNYAEYKAGKTTAGFVEHEIKALENLGFDYYKELEANAVALGAELKGATTADTIGVLLATFGSSAGTFGAIVSGVGWLVQSLSGKKRLTKEFQELAAKGQKDLAEINSIYTVYNPPVKSNSTLLFGVLAAMGAVIYYKRKKDV